MLLRSQPFTNAEAEGLLTPDQLRGPAYRQVMHGVHQPSEDVVSHGRRVLAFRKKHGPELVLLSRSAAWAHGASFAAPDAAVVVAIPSRHRLARTATVTPVFSPLRPDDVVVTPLGPATTPRRTAVDLARGVGERHAPLVDRVAQVDALIRATTLCAEEARDAVQGLERLHGLPSARSVLSLCRDGVDSFPETRLRLLVGDSGLPEPTTQCPVLLGGRTVARLDLGWPEAKVGCDYDGAVHLEPGQVRADLRRHNLVREAGWLVLQVDRHQMRHPDEVVRQLGRLLACRVRAAPTRAMS